MLSIALLATALTVECLLVVSAVLSPIPITVDQNFVQTLFVPYQKAFVPQRDLFLYGMGIMLGMAIFACLLSIVRFVKVSKAWDLKSLTVLHLSVAFLMGHAAFVIISMGNPVWAWPMFWGALILGIFLTIFWPDILSGVPVLKKWAASLKIPSWALPLLCCVLIFLVIFMPDLQAVVAREYLTSHFRDWDISIAGAAYALTRGLLPCVDVYTSYGFGAAVMTAKILSVLHGFDYSRVLGILMWAGIVYFVLWFLLLRRFLASTVLAMAAVVFAMRVQMFNNAVGTFIYSVPMSSVFRFCFDIAVFWMLWMHIQSRRFVFLILGAFCVSLGLFHMFSTGLSMFLAFTLYAAASAFFPALGGRKDFTLWRNHCLAVVSIFLWLGLWFYWSVGDHALGPLFYKNLVDFSSYQARGAFNGLLIQPLINRNTLLGLGGFVLPLFYLATFLYAVGLVVRQKSKKADVLAGLLAFYGLWAHMYYIVMVTQWYTMAVPGVMVLFYWINEGLAKLPLAHSRKISIGLLAAMFYCMFTAPSFTAYPNLLNFSRNPLVDMRTAFRTDASTDPDFDKAIAYFLDNSELPYYSLGQKDAASIFGGDFADDKALKDYYAKDTAWPEDVAMIKRLTPSGGQAAVLSSFEVLFLQRSDRKPFFYYYPLINSRPLIEKNFTQTRLASYIQLKRVMDQIESRKPEYIFMEMIFLAPKVPEYYLNNFEDLILLVQYLRVHYEPAEYSHFLVAMKRKDIEGK